MKERQRFLLVCLAVCMAAGLWGIYWIPQRWLEVSGMTGGWATIAQFLASVVLLSPFAFRRYLHGEQTGLNLPLAGALMGGGIVCYANSFLLTDVIRTMLLFYLTPFWATLIEVAIFRQRPGWWRAISLPLSLIGVAIVLGTETGFPMPRNVGDWLAVTGGAMYAAGAARLQFTKASGVYPIVFAFFVYGGVIAIVQAYFLAGYLGPMPSGATLLNLMPWFVLLCVIFFIPTNAIITWAPTHLGTGLFSILILSEVVFGTVSAALWANEVFGVRELLGSVLILLAGLIEVVLAPRNGLQSAVS